MIKKISKAGMAIALGISLLALNTNSVNAKVDNRAENEKLTWNNMAKVTAPELMAGPIANTIKNIEVSTKTLTLHPGETYNLKVIATLLDESTIDITEDSKIKYTSLNEKMGTVSSTGVLSVSNYSSMGRFGVIVDYGDYQSRCDITIEKDKSKEVEALIVKPNTAVMNPGKSLKLQVVAKMQDGSEKEVTGSKGLSYRSLDESKATISEDGTITIPNNASVGRVGVLINYGAAGNRFDITVEKEKSKEAESLIVKPNTAVMNPGKSLKLQVIAKMKDGSEKDITDSKDIRYNSLNESMASISSDGVITVLNSASVGRVGFTINYDGVGNRCDITVEKEKSKEVESLIVKPNTAVMNPGKSLKLQVIAKMKDGSEKDITESKDIRYNSLNESMASISSDGIITVLNSSSVGRVGFTINYDGAGNRCDITVEKDKSKQVKELIVKPQTVTIIEGSSSKLQVVAKMEDGSEQEITGNSEIVYKSLNPDVATINSNGEIRAVGNRSSNRARLTVSYRNGQCLVDVTVEKDKSKEVKELIVKPQMVTLVEGHTFKLEVFAKMEDGTEHEITGNNEIVYKSLNPDVATINSDGVISAVSIRSSDRARLSVNYKNAQYTVDVKIEKDKPKEIKQIIMRPKTATISKGETIDLKVIAIMDDGSEKDITEEVKNWYSDNDEVIELKREIGTVKGMKKGVARVIAYIKGHEDFPAECQITVVDNKEQNSVLNIEPEKDKIKLNELVTANLVMDNIENIAAEDVVIKYDSEKLKFVDMKEVDGIKLVKNDIKAGELRFILASKGKNNIVNAKKTLLKLNFQGIKRGEALVDIVKGRVSDGIESEYSLEEKQCGQATIIIDDMADVNNSGEFTLLDLAIDARHLGEDPAALKQYNTDIEVNGAIDDADLLEIANQMLLNPNYKL